MGRFSGELDLVGPERYSSDDCVPAPIKALAYRSQIVASRPRAPRIETGRDLGPHRSQAHAYRIRAFRKIIVGNEFVIPFNVVAHQIKENDSLFEGCSRPDQFIGPDVALVKRPKLLLNLRVPHYLSQLS